MPRNGSPEDPDHSDPPQYANYGGSSSQAYSDYTHDQPGYGQPGYGQPGYGQPGADNQAPEPSTWHRRPAVLIGLGVLTAVVLAFLVYAVVKFVGVDTPGPGRTPGSSATSSAVTTGSDTGANTATSSVPSTAATTETTETQTPTTSAAPTTTAPPTSSSTVTSTTTSVTTSTSTVTVTTSRAPWTLPTLFPRPKEDG